MNREGWIQKSIWQSITPRTSGYVAVRVFSKGGKPQRWILNFDGFRASKLRDTIALVEVSDLSTTFDVSLPGVISQDVHLPHLHVFDFLAEVQKQLKIFISGTPPASTS